MRFSGTSEESAMVVVTWSMDERGRVAQVGRRAMEGKRRVDGEASQQKVIPAAILDKPNPSVPQNFPLFEQCCLSDIFSKTYFSLQFSEDRPLRKLQRSRAGLS